jgi:protein SCO1
VTLILAAELPDWLTALPAINASLNSLATVLLVTGFLLIKQGKRDAHRNVMLTAFAVSVVFLVCYLTYHAGLHHYTGERGKPFTGTGAARTVYFTILISHVILAAVVPFLAVITIYRGLKADWVRHKKIAKVTFPVWLYVSITGVVIYLMLYHLPLE